MPRLQVLATAVLFSTGGAGIKATALSGWQVACFRSIVAALALVVLLPAARRRWTRRTVLVGSIYALALITYALANKLTTAASTIFLYSTAPLYIVLLGPWLLRERLRRRDLAAVGVMATGMAAILVGADPAVETAPQPELGNLIAALGGVLWALTMVGLRWLGRSGGLPRRETSASAVVAGNVIASLVCIPMALPVAGGGGRDVAVVVYLGVVQVALAYVLLTAALRSVPALEASLLLLLEPVLNPVWAWWLHGEIPGLWSLVGGLLILSVTVGLTLGAFGQSTQSTRGRDSPGQ